jgi:hypothetical protein
MNPSWTLSDAVFIIIAPSSSRRSGYVYKPSWNNFTNYPAFALNMPLMIVCVRERKRERNTGREEQPS